MLPLRACRILRLALAAALLVPLAATAGANLTGEQSARIARIDSLWRARAADAARDLIAAELPAARAAGDTAYAMLLIVRDGHMLTAMGSNLAAEPRLREGMKMATALRDSVWECIALRWLGVSISTQGRVAEGCELYAILAEKATRHDNQEYLAWGLLGMSFCDWQAGQLQEARRRYMRSAALFRQQDIPRGELMALNGLGNVLNSLGIHDEARTCFTRSARVGREIGFIYVEAMAENNLGTLEYSLGDPARAMRHFETARQLHIEDGSVRESIIPAGNIADCQIALGRYRDALAGLEPLLDECRQAGYRDLEATVRQRIAFVRGAQGRHHAAAEIFRQLIEGDSSRFPEDEMENLLALAVSVAKQDSVVAALELLRGREAWAMGLEDPLLRIQFRIEQASLLLEVGDNLQTLDHGGFVQQLADSLGLSGYGLRARTLAATAAARLGRPAQAIDRFEHAARIWEAERQVSLDPEWREQRGAAGRQIYTRLGALLLTHPPERPAAVRAARAFDALQVFKSRTLLERLRGPGLAGDVDDDHPTTLAELQSNVLDDGELLLDFYLGPESSLLFAVNRDLLRTVLLPGATELEPMLRLVHEILATPPAPGTAAGDGPASYASTFENTFDHLRSILFDGVADLLPDCRRLLYAPDGTLNLLPIAPLLLDSTAGDDTIRCASDCAVQRLPSATFLTRIRSRQPRGDEPAGAVLALRGGDPSSNAQLRGATREIDHLSSHFENVSITTRAPGDRPTIPARAGDTDAPDRPERVGSSSGLEGFDILHFAAHSTVDDQSPWLSAIHLDRPGTTGEVAPGDAVTGVATTGEVAPGDAPSLTARRIAELDLPARLVVLASCASAGGRILSGEGVLGLTSAFLSAGVPAVVATLWPVDDLSTSQLMVSFYDGLARGETVSTALRQAQQTLRASPDTEHPFYWAGFVVTGDADFTLLLRRRPFVDQRWGWMMLFGLVSVLGASLLIHRRRRRAGRLASIH